MMTLGIKRKRKRRTMMALFFSFVSGYVDGLGLFVLGDVFLSFMSGNSTRLGIQLVKGDLTQVMKYSSILIAFVGGAFLGDLLVSRIKKERLLVILSAEIVLLTMTMGFLQYTRATWLTFMPLTIAMGVQNHGQITINETILGKSYVSGQLFALGVAISKAFQGKQYWSQCLLCGLAWIFFILGGSTGAILAIAADPGLAILFLVLALAGLLLWLIVLEIRTTRVLSHSLNGKQTVEQPHMDQ